MSNLTFDQINSVYGPQIKDMVLRTGVAKVIQDDLFILLVIRPNLISSRFKNSLRHTATVDVFTFPKFDAEVVEADLSGYDLIDQLLEAGLLPSYQRLKGIAELFRLSVIISQEADATVKLATAADLPFTALKEVIDTLDKRLDTVLMKLYNFIFAYRQDHLKEIDLGEGNQSLEDQTGLQKVLRALRLV